MSTRCSDLERAFRVILPTNFTQAAAAVGRGSVGQGPGLRESARTEQVGDYRSECVSRMHADARCESRLRAVLCGNNRSFAAVVASRDNAGECAANRTDSAIESEFSE